MDPNELINGDLLPRNAPKPSSFHENTVQPQVPEVSLMFDNGIQHTKSLFEINSTTCQGGKSSLEKLSKKLTEIETESEQINHNDNPFEQNWLPKHLVQRTSDTLSKNKPNGIQSRPSTPNSIKLNKSRPNTPNNIIDKNKLNHTNGENSKFNDYEKYRCQQFNRDDVTNEQLNLGFNPRINEQISTKQMNLGMNPQISNKQMKLGLDPRLNEPMESRYNDNQQINKHLIDIESKQYKDQNKGRYIDTNNHLIEPIESYSVWKYKNQHMLLNEIQQQQNKQQIPKQFIKSPNQIEIINDIDQHYQELKNNHEEDIRNNYRFENNQTNNIQNPNLINYKNTSPINYEQQNPKGFHDQQGIHEHHKRNEINLKYPNNHLYNMKFLEEQQQQYHHQQDYNTNSTISNELNKIINYQSKHIEYLNKEIYNLNINNKLINNNIINKINLIESNQIQYYNNIESYIDKINNNFIYIKNKLNKFNHEMFEEQQDKQIQKNKYINKEYEEDDHDESECELINKTKKEKELGIYNFENKIETHFENIEKKLLNIINKKLNKSNINEPMHDSNHKDNNPINKNIKKVNSNEKEHKKQYNKDIQHEDLQNEHYHFNNDYIINENYIQRNIKNGINNKYKKEDEMNDNDNIKNKNIKKQIKSTCNNYSNDINKIKHIQKENIKINKKSPPKDIEKHNGQHASSNDNNSKRLLKKKSKKYDHEIFGENSKINLGQPNKLIGEYKQPIIYYQQPIDQPECYVVQSNRKSIGEEKKESGNKKKEKYETENRIKNPKEIDHKKMKKINKQFSNTIRSGPSNRPESTLANDEHSLTLNARELAVINEHIPSPEASVHIDMGDYQSSSSEEEDEDVSEEQSYSNDSMEEEEEESNDENCEPKEDPRGGGDTQWPTFYNNVVGKVHKMLQEEDFNHENQDEKFATVQVRMATIDQFKKMGISFVDDSPNSKRVTFNKKNILPQNHETDMKRSPLTAVTCNTNLSFASLQYLQRYHLLPSHNVQTQDKFREENQDV